MTFYQYIIFTLTLMTTLGGFAGEIVKLPDYHPQNPYSDTLRVELFTPKHDDTSFWTELSPFNTDFYNWGSEKTIHILPDRPKLIYKAWMQDHPAPLAIILPGTGGSYTSFTQTALAELIYEHGYSVIITSNALNWQFMESAMTSLVPGYTPQDAADIYDALRKIIPDLKKRYGQDQITRLVLIGSSLGALHTLFIAEMDEKERHIGFDKYLAINPPVDMMYAMRQIDDAFEIWYRWTRTQLDERSYRAGKLYTAFMNKMIKPDTPLPVTRGEAKFLIGFSFHLNLREVIFSIHARKDLELLKGSWSWFSRQDIYDQIDIYTFHKYIETFFKKYWTNIRKKPFNLEKINKESSLVALGPDLKDNKKVRVFHNINDFLIRPKDIKWLKDTFGDRLTLFDQGAHLGNLYRPEVQERIIKALEP